MAMMVLEACTVKCRVRICLPPPHVRVQAPHLLQAETGHLIAALDVEANKSTITTAAWRALGCACSIVNLLSGSCSSAVQGRKFESKSSELRSYLSIFVHRFK